MNVSALTVALAFSIGVTAWACDKTKTGCDKDKKVALAAAKVIKDAPAEKSPCGKAAKTAAAKKRGGCHSARKASADSGCPFSGQKKSAATASAKTVCIESAVDRAMAMMPEMTYKIDDLVIPCEKTARALAEANGKKVTCVVDGQSYHCRKTAMNKLADLMTERLPKLATVVSSVDGEVIHCSKTAAKLAAQKETDVSYVLAGVEFDCPKHAASVAAKLAARMKDVKASGCGTSKSGCDKAKQAADSVCDKSAAKTASAKSGCDKAKAKTASAKSGCCKSKGDAKTASAKADGCCNKGDAKAARVASAGGAADDESDESDALNRAKRMVREIVQFVSSERTSSS